MNGKSTWNFILRHSLWIVLLIVSMILTPIASNFSPAWKALTLVIAFESMALFLCGIANFVYTKISFENEQPNILGFVFTGVHILVAVTIAGVYWLEFLKQNVMPV